MSLVRLIPDAETLLALPLEELAFYVLQAVSSSGMGLRHLQSVLNELGGGVTPGAAGYPQRFRNEIEVAVTEAWQWLENELIIVRAPGVNGNNGYRVLGRRAKNLNTRDQFKALTQAKAFPKEVLHPLIAERSWINVMRGDFEAAVLFSFKAVEIAVREAGEFTDGDIGVPLMRKAFHPETGPLTRMSDQAAEREALMHLFAGAIGSYKNPHSHRNVALKDAAEAQEMVMLASHLLRIVDSRRPS